MTPSPSAAPTDDLFAAIAARLEPAQREHFYQRMLYFRQLRPDDELLRIAEAMGFLALVIRDAPHAVAVEREQLAELLTTALGSLQAAVQAGQAYQQQLERRLATLPAEIANGRPRSRRRSRRACASSLCARACRPPPRPSRSWPRR